MATIAEILAARNAGKTGTPATETLPPAPGKPVGPSGAPILNRTQAADPQPKGVPAEEVPRAPEPKRRSLSERQGEAVPLVPEGADTELATWHHCMNAFETELCLMRDPEDPEVAWLAVRPLRVDMNPILIHRLPWLLWEHPATVAEDNSSY